MSRSIKYNRDYEHDYIMANRRGSRDAELEVSTGFSSKSKIHRSSKSYSRNPKHRNQMGY